MKMNAHLITLKYTDDKQAIWKTLVERYTAQGASGGWWGGRWQIA